MSDKPAETQAKELIIRSKSITDQGFIEPQKSIDLEDPYKNIYSYTQEYIKSKGMTETLGVMMHKDYVDEIQKHSGRIAAILGIHNGRIVISLVALKDNEYTVIDGHVDGTVPGQQVWPQILVQDFKTIMRTPK